MPVDRPEKKFRALDEADALIAATAVEHGERPYTANDTQYKCSPDLQMNIFRPN